MAEQDGGRRRDGARGGRRHGAWRSAAKTLDVSDASVDPSCSPAHEPAVAGVRALPSAQPSATRSERIDGWTRMVDVARTTWLLHAAYD
jgi:hypothetical protein